MICFTPENANDRPIAYSPVAAILHGREPDLMYCAMFLSRSFRYCQPFASPFICRMLSIIRKPVPELAALGMTIWPLYTGLSRSCHDAGIGRFFFFSTSVLTQKPAK
jgi:hypothetical protein